MNYRNICLALASIGTFDIALAQSSVTLAGTVDLSAARIKNSTSNSSVSQYQLRTDGFQPTRLVVRGTEDLGDGLRASFVLDAGVNADTGTANPKFWGRRSTLSLTSPWGELRLGRDFNPTYWNAAFFDPFGNSGVGALYNLVTVLGSNAATLFRTDNSIGYFLPAGLAGVYGQAMVSASEGSAGNKYKGARLGYVGGRFDGALAYGQTDTFPGGPKYSIGNLGFSYDFKVVKLMAQFTNQTFAGKRQRTYLAGTAIPIGVGEIHATYVKADASGAGTDANDGSQIALGYVYNLSKLTTLYGTYARLKNRGAANFSIFGTTGSAQGGTSQGAEVGMRKSF